MMEGLELLDRTLDTCEEVRTLLRYPNGERRKDADVDWARCVQLMEEANNLGAQIGLPKSYDVEKYRQVEAKYATQRLK